ncbi:MAG: 3-deoxy-manno-octulosonate cytidylyltransferase [Gammaproteobacteria bacterium]
MSPAFKVLIPARYGSSRLAGKPLMMIGQKTLIQHVYESACASHAEKVIIATDDDRIDDVGRSLGATVVMTSREHLSGTDRIYEAVKKLGCPDDEIIVNVQGDEFGLAPELINTVAATLDNHWDVQIATLCEKITTETDYQNPNTVKLVMEKNQRAMYFSRAPIPWQPKSTTGAVSPGFYGYKHIGIYAYRCGFLRTFAGLEKPPLEQTESLEQLRALYHGYPIQVAEVTVKGGIEVNTEEDLWRARKSIKNEA